MLRRETPHLQIVRDRRAQFDDVLIEERYPHLERVSHRHTVEVVEKRVDEGEPAVEVQRGGERVVGEAARQGSSAPEHDRVVRGRERALRQRLPQLAIQPAAHRKMAIRRAGRGERPRRPTNAGRADTSRGRGGARPRTAEALPAPGQRRGAVLLVAAEQLVRALTGERDRDLLGREPRERVEAQRREVREGLVEVPEEVRADRRCRR